MKGDLRAELLAKRAAVPPEERKAFAERLAAIGPALLPEEDGLPRPVVGLYQPLRGEADPSLLLATLAERGITTALPVTVGRGEPLLFRAWRSGDPLVPGHHGVRNPVATAPLVEPDVLFVPLVGFDRRCARLGYGAGYYDRTLEVLRQRKAVLAIGVSFACQEVLYIPTDSHDQPLDMVVTERGVTLRDDFDSED